MKVILEMTEEEYNDYLIVKKKIDSHAFVDIETVTLETFLKMKYYKMVGDPTYAFGKDAFVDPNDGLMYDMAIEKYANLDDSVQVFVVNRKRRQLYDDN